MDVLIFGGLLGFFFVWALGYLIFNTDESNSRIVRVLALLPLSLSAGALVGASAVFVTVIASYAITGEPGDPEAFGLLFYLIVGAFCAVSTAMAWNKKQQKAPPAEASGAKR